MNNAPRGQAAKRLHKTSEIDPDLVRVQFSPEILTSLTRLEAAVHHSDHFSSDILANLQEGYTNGTPMLLHHAFTLIACVTKEAMKHVDATGDQRAKEALDNFISHLLGLGPDEKLPFVVTKDRVPTL